MIYCGNDIVNIDRFKSIVLKYGKIDNSNKFLNRIFSNDELVFLKTKNFNINTLAGRFSAKEAVIKALNTIYKISTLKEIQILNDIPVVKLDKVLNIKNITISISHDANFAISLCIVET